MIEGLHNVHAVHLLQTLNDDLRLVRREVMTRQGILMAFLKTLFHEWDRWILADLLEDRYADFLSKNIMKRLLDFFHLKQLLLVVHGSFGDQMPLVCHGSCRLGSMLRQGCQRTLP